jgi:integrase
MARTWQQGSITSTVRRVVGPEGKVARVTTYTGVFRDTAGQRHKKSFPEKAQAADWLRQEIGRVQVGTYTAPPKAVTFGEFCTTWLAARKLHIQPATLRTYQTLLGTGRAAESQTTRTRLIAPPVEAWGARKLATLTAADMVAYFARAVAAGFGAQSLVNLRTCLSTLFSDAVALGHLGAHPLKNRLVKIPTAPRAARKMNAAPSKDVAARFVNWAQEHEPRVYLLVLLMAGASLRPGEAAAVQVKAVDRGRGLLQITRKYDPRAQVYGAPKTAAGRRAVQIAPAIVAAIDAVLIARWGSVAAADPEANLLDGFDVAAFCKQPTGWRRCLQRARCPHFSPYSLRHYFASAHLSEGRSPQWVAQQMGHSSPVITWRAYADVIETDRPGDALVAELLGGPKPGTTEGTTARETPPNAAEPREATIENR